MASDDTVEPVLFVNDAPVVGMRVPDRNVPKARSGMPAAPKLYTSPALSLPVLAAYASLLRALVPDSARYQPVGSVVLVVPLVASVSNVCV
jgi:uncharacterized RDD family membrane protein YckC